MHRARNHVEDLGDDTVTISGKHIACRIEQTEALTPGGRIVTKTWLSDRVSPYVLRRERTTYDRDNDEVVSQTQVEVVALSRAIRLLRRHRQAAEMRVVYTHPGGVIRTTAVVEPGSARRRRGARIGRVRRAMDGWPGEANCNSSAIRASSCRPCCVRPRHASLRCRVP